MNDGTITASLRLLIDEAIKQAKAASVAINKELGIKPPDTSNAVRDTAKAADAQKKHGDEVRRTNKSLSEQQQRLRDIASGKLSPVQVGMTIKDDPKKYDPWTDKERAALGPTLNPSGAKGDAPGKPEPKQFDVFRRVLSINTPQVPGGFPSLPHATPVTSAVSSMKSIMPMLAAAMGTGVGGPLGGAIAGVLTKLNPAVAAVTAGMTLLRMAAQETAKAFEQARAIYAKSAGSGFGVRQTVQRGALASAIGVSEAEIYQYGAAIEQLNAQLEPAIRTISQANGTLTLVAWNFSVLETNLKALWATVAEATAPAINELLRFASAMTQLATLSHIGTVLGAIFGTLIDWITRLAAIISLFPATIMLVDTAIMDGIKNLVADIQNYLASTRIGKILGIEKTDKPGFQNTKDAFEAYKTILKTIIGAPKIGETAGTPQQFMKQMPVSAWERMGLNIGGGGGTNYNQQTANNTKKLTAQMEKLHNAVMNGKANFGIPKGMPAGA